MVCLAEEHPITIDFETRSEADLRDVGAWNYSKHVSTLVLCLAFSLTPTGPIDLWKPGDPPPTKLFTAFESGRLVEAHNAFFEKCIWRHVCADRMGWPRIPFEAWRCSMAKAQACGLPGSLEMVASALGVNAQKDMKGRRVMLKLCKPRKPSKNNPDKWFNDPKDFQTLYDYCVKDVDVERQVSLALPDLSPRELKIWQLDQVINTRGLPIDRNAVAAGIAICEDVAGKNNARIAKVTGGEVTTTGQIGKLKTWVAGEGVEFESLNAASIDEALKVRTAPPHILEALELRRQGSLSSTKKLASMFARSDETLRVRNCLRYHGAHTGRWAGMGLQIQNMPSDRFSRKGDHFYRTDAEVDTRVDREIETLINAIKLRRADFLGATYDDPMDAVKWSIRSMIAAPEGKKFVVADFASIEARVLAWVAGDQTALDIFNGDGKIYEAMAADIYGVNASGVTKDQRADGKVAILGLGFQMGAMKFHSTLHSFGRKEATPEFAQRCVDVYRAKFGKIKKYWGDVQRAALGATLETGTPFYVGEGNARVRFQKDGLFLRCTLPSGRHLHYYKPAVIETHTAYGPRPCLTYAGVDQFTRQWTRIQTYGGKLTENIVQATARDFLANAMFACEANGYPIIATIHDEIFSEVEESFGSVSEMVDLISVVPTWGNGCPITAEGFEAKRYRK